MFAKFFKELGGAEEDRTPDPLLAKQVLSQLSYSPIRVLSHAQNQSSKLKSQKFFYL